MNTRHITILAIAAFTLSQAFARASDDPSSAITMQPLEGVSLDIGAEHAITYFLSENGQCKLVVTAAPTADTDGRSFTATRFEATIDGGDTMRYLANGGQAIDFDCEPSAHTVSIHAAGVSDAVAAR